MGLVWLIYFLQRKLIFLVVSFQFIQVFAASLGLIPLLPKASRRTILDLITYRLHTFTSLHVTHKSLDLFMLFIWFLEEKIMSFPKTN